MFFGGTSDDSGFTGIIRGRRITGSRFATKVVVTPVMRWANRFASHEVINLLHVNRFIFHQGIFHGMQHIDVVFENFLRTFIAIIE